MHEYIQCIRAPPTLVYGGNNYLARQNGDSALASLPFFEDYRQICVLRDLYGVAILLACAWSRALTTAWSRAYCAITIIINGV